MGPVGRPVCGLATAAAGVPYMADEASRARVSASVCLSAANPVDVARLPPSLLLN